MVIQLWRGVEVTASWCREQVRGLMVERRLVLEGRRVRVRMLVLFIKATRLKARFNLDVKASTQHFFLMGCGRQVMRSVQAVVDALAQRREFIEFKFAVST